MKTINIYFTLHYKMQNFGCFCFSHLFFFVSNLSTTFASGGDGGGNGGCKVNTNKN